MVGLWLVATVAAGLLVMAGVDAVADDVADPSPAAVAPTDERAAATSTTATGVPPATGPAASPASPTTTPTASARPPASAPTATTVPAAAPVTTTTAPTPEPEPGEVKTFNGEGGSVSIRFRSTSVELVVATPASGYAVDVEDSGPARVRVRFRGDDHETRIEARAGETTAEVSESGG